MQEYSYYIAGEFRRSEEALTVVNSATEEPFARIFQSSQKDIEDALFAAQNAQKQWRGFSYKERAKLLREVARVMLDNVQILAELESKETGKIFKESLFVDIPFGAECFHYYASFLESLQEKLVRSDGGINLVKYEPFGVVGVFLPYNVPLMIFGFSCAAALAAGNALVIKPSEYGSLSLLEFARYIDLLDIPRGLISIISGRGETTGRILSESNVDMISFTGRRTTLQKIIAQSSLSPKKIVCELGGSNLTFIFSDADRENALQNVLAASFMKSGQMCVGTSVILVEDSIYKEFVNDLVKKARDIKVGDPFDSTSGMGALVSEEHVLDVERRIRELISKGGAILCGGERLNKKGYFFPPTVIEIRDMVYEEFFAPVVLVRSFKRDDAAAIIENNPTGLVLQIWTKDIKMANDLAEKAKCGTVWINTFVQMDSHTPFGGMQTSGWGRELGKAGFFEYVQTKHIGMGFKSTPVWGWFGV